MTLPGACPSPDKGRAEGSEATGVPREGHPSSEGREADTQCGRINKNCQGINLGGFCISLIFNMLQNQYSSSFHIWCNFCRLIIIS